MVGDPVVPDTTALGADPPEEMLIQSCTSDAGRTAAPNLDIRRSR
jgi:hypothetical protein